MEVFDKQKYASLLVKGNLHGAIHYLEECSDQDELLSQYYEVFQSNKDLNVHENALLDKLIGLYQAYYKDVFWNRENPNKAEQKLFSDLWRFCGENNALEKNSSIEDEVEKIVRSQGFEFLGGDTAGYYGPYIWETSCEETYDVELPSGVETYSIIMMDGFVSRSWLDFLSFGQVGTGGWSGKDGTLCCVKSLYDMDSPDFKISFLKHEAQHALDKRTFKGITSAELEYRAKLVELIYWEDEKMIKRFFMEAENEDHRNSHAISSHRIICDLSMKLFEKEQVKDLCAFTGVLDDIRVVSKELLLEDTAKLRERK